MLRQGIFTTPRGSMYSIFEVNESNFYRFDITEDGAQFHIDYESVIYSQVRRKKTYEYGDRTIYNEYSTILREANSVNAQSIPETPRWDNGKFIQKYTKEDPKQNFLYVTEMINGNVGSVTIQYKGYTIVLDTLQMVYGVKLEPINFLDYKEVGIASKNTSNITTPYLPLKLLKAKYDIAHIDNERFDVVTDVEKAREYLKTFVTSAEPLRGFDTETTGTDVSMYGDDKLVGVILAWSEHDSIYFPFRHQKFTNLPIEFLAEIVEAMNKVWERLIAHNFSFDYQVMLKEGYHVKCKWDSMQLSWIINPVMEKGVHGLKELVNEITGKVYLELTDIFISSKLIDFSALPIDIVKVYACPDGSNVITVFKNLLQKLPSVQDRLLNLECDLVPLKAEQEYYGMRVDVKRYEEQYVNCNYILDVLIKAFRTMTHVTGNINSADVLRDLLYNKMRCKVLQRTPTGLASTSGATISKLAHQKASTPHNITQDIVDLNGKVVIKAKDLSESKYPVLLILDKYREYNKRKTAFYARFERTMKTGRIFFWINQNGAASGRQSSPMHQLPPELKDVMLSDTPHHKFWGPDYSQVELRMIAYLAGERELIELCKNPDNDIHRVIGSLISNKEMWEITPEERSIGKRRNFGVVYLISGFGLAGQIKGPGYTMQDVMFCQQQLDEFYHRFPRINRYLARNKNFVLTHGYMETKIMKRRRLFKEIFDPDITSRRKASLLRQANNMPVQGTAADLLKQAEVNFWNYIHNKGWDKLTEEGFPLVRPMLSIHDEVLISAHESIPIEEIVTMITECMEISLDGAPPFFVQPACMESWGGHTDDSLAMPIKLRDKLIADYKETGISQITYETYKDVLDKYRDQILHDYMYDLINKYGTDYIAVGEHVRHPAFTFDLLDRYSKQLKSLDLSHEEKINEAAKLYIEEHVDGTYVAPEETSKETKESDRDKFFEEIEDSVRFDEYGNVIYEDTNEQDEYEESIYDDEQYIDYRISGEVMKVWETADVIMLDLNDVSKEDANKVIAEVYKSADTDGFYRVWLLYNNQTLDAKFNVETLDISHISEMICNYEKVG